MQDRETRREQMVIDNEFRDLIPPLSADERSGLEASIREEGVRDPLVVWGDILIDGHNRYEIATELGVEYQTISREFEDRDAAKIWIIDNQLNRRNIVPAVRIDLAEVRRELIAAEQRIGRPPKGEEIRQNSASFSPDDRKTDAQIGQAAGVSRDTVQKWGRVREAGDEDVVEAVRAGEMSIHKADQTVKARAKDARPWTEDETALREAVEAGETVTAAMSYPLSPNPGRHHRLIEWAKAEERFVRIDRKSEWGNPFEIDKDGDRETVIQKYADYYLPHKDELQRRIQAGELRGKVLGCWCAPHACHGDVLKAQS